MLYLAKKKTKTHKAKTLPRVKKNLMKNLMKIKSIVRSNITVITQGNRWRGRTGGGGGGGGEGGGGGG